MKGVTVISHPLVQQGLARLRHRDTQPQEFRRLLGEIAALMVYEATRDLEVRNVRVPTPLAISPGTQLRREVVLVPVLRAGLGMLEAILKLIPNARVGFIGLHRNEETLCAETYHASLPRDLRRFEVLLIDPMLATGGSAIAALELLQNRRASRMRMVNLVAAPEGILKLRRQFPKLPIFTAAIDDHLNHQGYIVPGLGDAGDRLFGV